MRGCYGATDERSELIRERDMIDIKTGEKRVGTFKADWFKPPAFMAVKKLARDLCTRMRSEGLTKADASEAAIQEVFRRLPSFVLEWEAYYGRSWKGNDWFKSRIDHQSEDKDNKTAQMKITDFVGTVLDDDSIYSWGAWESSVEANLNEVNQAYWLYLLPFSFSRERTNYDIQKVGITTSLVNRYREYECRSPTGEAVSGVGLWPAPRFVVRCGLGNLLRYQARTVENDCVTAVGNGRPPWRGDEWFRTSVDKAVKSVVSVLKVRGLIPEVTHL